MITYEDAKALLQRNDQDHLLRFWDDLNDNKKNGLLSQIENLDFENVSYILELLSKSDSESTPSDMEPAKVIELPEFTSICESEGLVPLGEKAISDGEVGVVLVAGGQGTRLGFDGPKGAYPLAPISDASLFEIHSRKILALERKYNAEIPFYIMTSEANDAATREFFEQNDFFGLSLSRVKFFVQGMWPALTADGKVILETPDHIFKGPDGHGGTLTALKTRGMLDDMDARSVKTVFYFQVDNPLVEIASPAFIGLHLQRKSEVSVKLCAKRDPDEGLGMVIERDGKNMVVEYTELTKEQKEETMPDGRLRLLFGSVAIHIFSVDFMKQEASAQMPVHIAHKKVPYCNENGETVKPETPNAYKFEKFIFDVLPDAQKSINVEFLREEEFSPVKNAEGSDSPETSRNDMMMKFARWFEKCGIEVPRDDAGMPKYKIEIDPCFALNADDLKNQLSADFEINGDLLLAESDDEE
ncbi:UDPGP type 1 family protein [PVC group bacterium]|nr:UDPGP type 1 family protein [PVC group bacterium]